MLSIHGSKVLIGSLGDGWTKYFDIKIPRDPSFMRVTGRWAGQDAAATSRRSHISHFTNSSRQSGLSSSLELIPKFLKLISQDRGFKQFHQFNLKISLNLKM